MVASVDNLDRLRGNVVGECGHSLLGNSPLGEVQQRGKTRFFV